MLTVKVWVWPGWMGGLAGIVGAAAGAVIWRLCVNWPVLVTMKVTVPHGIVVREKLNLGGTIVTVTVVETGCEHPEPTLGVVDVDVLAGAAVTGRIAAAGELTSRSALSCLPATVRATARKLPGFVKLTT